MEFITNLAYVFAVLSGLLLVLRCIGYSLYTELDKKVDKYNGIKRTFPMTTPFIIFVVCICWIMSQ